MSLLYSKDQEYGKYSLEITQELLTKMNEPVIKTASIKNIDEDSSPVYSRPYQLIKAQSEILSIIKVSEEEGEKDEDSKSFGSFSFLGIKQEENCDYSEKDVVMIYVQTKVENLEMVEEVRILQANLIDVTKHKVFIDNEKIVNINKEKMQEIAVKQNSTCDLIKDIIVDITGKLQNEQNIIIVDTDNNEKKNEYIQEQECLRSEETFIDNLEKELENKSKIQKEKKLNLEDVSRTDNEIEKQKRTLKNEELIISPEITLEEKKIENINENTQHDLEIQNKITINKLEELSQIKIPENEEFILKNKENLLQTENLQDKIIIPENDNIILNNKENIFQSEFEKIVKIQENEEIVLNEKEIFFQSKEFENKIKISENEELLDKKIVFVSSEDAQIQTEDNNNIVGTIQTNENQSNNIKILDPINNIKASNEAIYFNCDENSDTILQKELNNEEFNLESKNIEKEIYDYPNTHKDGSANFYHNIIDEIKDFDEKNNLKKEKSIQKEFTSTIEADMSINRSLIEENFEKNPNYFDSNISSKLQSEDLGSPYLNELFCNGSPQISHKKNSSCDDDSEDIQLQKATFYQKLATINQFEDKDNNETSQIKKEETEFLEEGIDENKIINLPTDFFNEKKIQQSQNEYNNLEKEHVKNKIYDSKTEEISLKNQESSKEGDSYEKSTAEPGSMILKNSNSCLDDQQSIIIKQGFLYKKSGNFLTGWQVYLY